MDRSNSQDMPSRPTGRLILPVVILLGFLLVAFTWLGIRKSRSDSLELMRTQGSALIESLTLSADNAIKANSFFDLLTREKFSDLATFLEGRSDEEFTPQELGDFALGYGVDAILIYNDSASLTAAGARGVDISIDYLHNLIYPEVARLLDDSTRYNEMFNIAGDVPGEISLFYLEENVDRDDIIVIVSDALFYSESKKNIGIGYLVRNIAREVGIEYIIFQTEQGIVFSSREIGPILKIEKDPFLFEALTTDSVRSRLYDFNDREILEMIRPFVSTEYGKGLFRLGMSLDKYKQIISGYDTQMIILGLVLFAAVVLTMMYLSGKQKRVYLDRSYRRVKGLSDKVFDSINSGLIAIDREGKVETANSQILKMFGIAEEDLIGKKWNDLSFRRVVPFGDFISGSETSAETRTEYFNNDDTCYYLVNMARLYDPENRPAGAVAIIYDYTHIRDLEQNARRRERLSEMGDLAAGVAHEIRNPLNAISIAAQRLMSEFEPKENTEEFTDFARQIKSEAGRLNEIVTRFLSMTRNRGQSEELINVSRIVSDTVNFLTMEKEETGVRIIGDISEGISLPISEDRLKQLIINLVRNGVEASPNDSGAVKVVLKKDTDAVVLTVQDNGPGVPENIKERIFNPYFSTKENGTGLGLSIVHQIVEEFKGTIEVVSSGEGAEFRIEIPIK